MSGELPKGWSAEALGHLTSKIGSGATPRGGERAYKTHGTPLIRSMNVHFTGFRKDGLAFLDEDQARALDSVTVQPDDVLLNITGASIGRVTQAPNEMENARVNQHVCIIRPLDGISPAFVSRYLSSPRMQVFVAGENYGVTRQALTKEMIEGISLPVPPLAEQHRIVAKIDSLFARSSRARDELAHIPRLIERYRQAVLEAAFRGDLTADWRNKSASVVDPSQTVANLIAQRLETGGTREILFKQPQKILDDSINSPWQYTTLEQICHQTRGIPYGIVQTGKPVEGGVPTVRCGDIKNFEIDVSMLKKVDPTISAEYGRTVLQGGEVLITIRGSIGESAVVPKTMKGMNISREVAMIPVLPGMDADFIAYLLASPQGSRFLAKHIKGVAQTGINLSDIRSFPVPIPSNAEQKEIVHQIETRFRAAQHIADETIQALSRLSRLDASILDKAFTGQLVPQDPNDEPASKLLDRIRAARAAAPAVKRGRKAKGAADGGLF
ncbi:restriction endonuclease subunit S [Niveispirillum sp. KHB5.9]|uniref:restriction endonuclease subunit S n=1 Tax=Niveispirillum sp. KHB5.9 TaxID=3400269 RepID=UPI003A87680F